MAPADDFSVVPPPPSYPTETYQDYKVFPDVVEQTIDQILDEEADLEESRSSDWPFYSGADGSGDSPTSGLLRGRDAEKAPVELSPSREMAKSKAKKTKKLTTSKKKQTAAKREITVIDLCTDDEDFAPEDMDVDHDKHDECDDPKEVDGDDNLQTVNTAEADSDDTSKYVDAMEGGVEPANQNNVTAKTAEPGPVDVKAVDVKAVDVKAVEANVAVGDENGVSETTTSKKDSRSVKDRAEEAFIFSSVAQSVKGHVLHFIVTHPFMSQFVQPVKRSARRQFIRELCGKAISVGLEHSMLWSLIKYVRMLYLDSAGVDAEPLADDLNDIPFGQEIDDEPEPTPHSRKSHKRSRNESSAMGLKTKRSKRRLLDHQEPPQPTAVPEVIEIADDNTSLLSPKLPDAPSYAEDEHTTLVQAQSTSGLPIDPVVADSDEVQKEVSESPLVESTSGLPSHPPDVQTHNNDEGTTTVQVETTPELPPESGHATVSNTAQTNPTEDFIKPTLSIELLIEETTSAHDVEGPLEDAQKVSNPAWAGERSNDEVILKSEHKPEISPQVAIVKLLKKPNPIVVTDQNKNPPVHLSKSQKRKARRKLLKKAIKEGQIAEAGDDVQPALPLQMAVVSDDANKAPTAQESVTAEVSVKSEVVPGNLDESNGLAEPATDVIQENLFPDLPSEPSSKASAKLSKNQKRQERRRAQQEKKAKKNQERREKELKAQQEPADSWIKHHKELSSQDPPVQALQAKKWQAPVPLSKPRAKDPEPRKEKKRKERENKREQKRERKRKRESLKLELDSSIIDDDQDQDDLLPKDDPKLDEHELEQQRKKERRQAWKRQKQSLALDHNTDDVEDDFTEGVWLSDGSIELPELANDGGEGETSPSYDEPKVRVDVARETPQPENTDAEKASSVSTTQPEGLVSMTSVREPMSTPQRDISTAVPMPTSTPMSRCTSASGSRYGPLSPDPKEWDSDF